MNAFHVIGGLTALWAVLLAAVGITRADFLRGGGATEKVVTLVSVVLVLGSISTAVITAETPEHEGTHEEGPTGQDLHEGGSTPEDADPAHEGEEDPQVPPPASDQGD